VHARMFGVMAALGALALPAPVAALPAPGTSPFAGQRAAGLERVTVTRDDGRSLAFAVRLTAPTTVDAMRVQVMLDVDRNPATGIQGSEFALDYSAPVRGGPAYASLLSLRDWQMFESRPRSLQVSTSSSSLTFRISPAELGNPSSFGFWVFVARGNTVMDTLPADVLATPTPTGWTFPAGTGGVSYSDAGGGLSRGEALLAVGAFVGLAVLLALGLRVELHVPRQKPPAAAAR
jgi:hypothetical protein